MKTTKILFIAAAAVAMTLASCTKEQTGTTENGQTSGLRTLTVSFATSPTRTTLDGLQPKWKENDQILLADGTNEMETHTVTAAEAGTTSFEITTSLTGTITAVYPKAAALTSGNSITGIKVSATQNGSFGSANICMATAAATEKELTFKNKTAVFEVSVPSGTKQLTVTSLNPVSDGQRAASGAVAIADASATTITVGNNTADIPNPCYVSVLAPATGAVLLQDLNFDTGSAQGGFSPKYITSKGKTPSSYAVEVNTMYTLEAASLHEYVTVAGKKWATQNVAVTASGKRVFGSTGLVVGDYFQWASHAGYCGSASDADGGFLIYSAFTNNKCGDGEDAFTFKSGVGKFGTKTGTDGVVAWSPYCDNTTGKYDNTYSASTKTRLDLEDDAAFYFWGGAWRMPTKQEFSDLLDKTFTNVSHLSNGILTINGHPSLIFPAAGYGSGAKLNSAGSIGYYWSSSLSTGNPDFAYDLYISSTSVSVGSGNRQYGYSVRPFSE